MANSNYETNKHDIIAAMDAVINKLDSDEGSPRKVKRDLLTRIKELYTAKRTKENFDLFVKTANIHTTKINFGGSTESLTIFKNTLTEKKVTITITNVRFKDLSEAKKFIESPTQPVQAGVLQPDPAQALREHQAAHRALLEDEKSRFSNLLSEETPQREEIIRQFQEFLNEKYPEPTQVGPSITLASNLTEQFYAARLSELQAAHRALLESEKSRFSDSLNVDTPQREEIIQNFQEFLNREYSEPTQAGPSITLASNLTEQFFTEKFNTVLKFPKLYDFLTSQENKESIFAKNLRTSFNSSSSPLYGRYAGLKDLVSHSESNDVFPTVLNSTTLEASNDEAQVGQSSSTASNTQVNAVSGLKLIFDPKYAGLTPHDSFELSETDFVSYKSAMQASIDAPSSLDCNKKEKKGILTEIKGHFDKSTDLKEQFNLIHLFMDVAKTHRTGFDYGFFKAKETNSFLEFKNALANNLLHKLIPPQSSGPSNT